MRPFDYVRPADADEALALLAEPGTTALAGGTNLVDLMRLGVARPERVVDVVQERVRGRLWRDVETNHWLDAQLPALEAGSTNPFDVADALLARSGNLLTQTR